jgi:hypothetical protein
MSSPTISGSVTISDKPVARSLGDANGKTHYLVKFDVKFSFCSNTDGSDCFKQHIKGIKCVTRHTL